MRAVPDVLHNHSFEVAAANAVKVEENIEAVVGQVLKDCQCPGTVCAAITEEYCFLDPSHVEPLFPPRYRQNEPYQSRSFTGE